MSNFFEFLFILKFVTKKLHAQCACRLEILLAQRKKCMHLCKCACVKSSTADITICPEGVEKLLKNLDLNKATGPDNIGPRILQIAAEELGPALSLIFQRSLDTGDLPESWFQTNISPIYKKGDRTLAENYRPVSLTSVCCKVLEHIIHSNIMHHFNTQYPLNPYR